MTYGSRVPQLNQAELEAMLGWATTAGGFVLSQMQPQHFDELYKGFKGSYAGSQEELKMLIMFARFGKDALSVYGLRQSVEDLQEAKNFWETAFALMKVASGAYSLYKLFNLLQEIDKIEKAVAEYWPVRDRYRTV